VEGRYKDHASDVGELRALGRAKQAEAICNGMAGFLITRHEEQNLRAARVLWREEEHRQGSSIVAGSKDDQGAGGELELRYYA
jgi:hypothetical protein